MRKLFGIIAAAVLLLAGAPAAAQVTTVYLVRHAEKDVEPAGDPALSAAGMARAQALADLLGEAGVSGVFVTEYARTRQTAQPLADRMGVTPEVVPARAGLREQAQAIGQLVHGQYAGKTVLVVGHSNTIPIIVSALSGRPTDEICDGTYATLFVVTLREGAAPVVERRSYGAADPADACAGNG